MVRMTAAVILIYFASAACYADEDDIGTTFNFPGKIKTIKYVKVKVDKEEVEIPIINGYAPNQFVEWQETKDKKTWKITGRVFNYDKVKYGDKLEYTFEKRGFNIMEESTDKTGEKRFISDSKSRIFKIKK